MGETFPAEDGCNTCRCEADGRVACTLIGCEPGDGGASGGGDVCQYGGKTYRAGDTFPSTDGCNSCSCGPGGSVGCTERACLPLGGCAYGGKRYAVGDAFPSTDGCNTCSCGQDGTVACTRKLCPTKSCRRGGCSGELCTDRDDVASDCAFRPEYACYQKAPCERQPDGLCGFTPTPELQQCLAAVSGGDAGVPSARCDFAARYEYGAIGGLRFWVDRSFLAPGNAYRHTRTFVRGDRADQSCAPVLPVCGTQGAVTAYEIEVQGLMSADVQAALSQPVPPLYGRDLRPVDGTVFEFKRTDGRGFLVGASCDPTSSACRPIPPGVQRLRDHLLMLDRQQLASPACVNAGFTP